MPLDIGLGILIALGAAEYAGTEATLALVFFGIASALLPDIDILTIPLLGKWHHRTHTHYPLTYIPLVFLGYLFLDPLCATIFTLGIYAHFIHDTFGIGWGIAWLWPFSSRRFLFFPPRAEAARDTHWVRYYYFRPNMLAYIEYGVLLIAVGVLTTYFW